MPDGLVKCVSCEQPSICAVWFIRSAKEEMLPLMYSAMALAPSLPERTSVAATRSPMGTFSPALTGMVA